MRILTDLAGNDQPKHMWHSVRCIIYSRVTKHSAEGVEHVSSLAGIQLFRERLSEKGHATILKGIVDGFLFTVFQKNFQRTAREAMNVCLRMLKESNKSRFDSYSVRNSVLIISQNTFRDCSVHSFSDNLSRNNCMLNQCSLVLYAAVLCVVTQSCNRSLFLPFCGEKRYVTTERPGVKGNRNNFDTV